eukprot:Ihof_evm6s33 gene=Ihof_evmTU6s33
MGRVARYKKAKSFKDPKEHARDQAPGAIKEKPGKAMRRIMETKRLIEYSAAKRAEKKLRQAGDIPGKKYFDTNKEGVEQQGKKREVAAGMKRDFNESLVEFNERVDREYANKVAKGFIKVNRKAEKGKAYLKRKKEAKRMKKAGENDDRVVKGENVAFGDIVHAPPVISKLPRRKAVKSTGQPLLLEKDKKEQSKPVNTKDNKGKVVHRLVKEKEKDKDSATAAPEEGALPKTKKRKNMDEATRRIMDTAREAAILQ